MTVHGAGDVAHAALALNVALMKHLESKGMLQQQDGGVILNSAIGSIAAHPHANEVAEAIKNLVPKA